MKIKENSWKCLPEGKCSKFIKNKIFFYLKTLINDEKVVELKNIWKIGVKLKLFERKLEFWNLIENWSLEN